MVPFVFIASNCNLGLYFFTLFCGMIYIYVTTRAKFNDYYFPSAKVHYNSYLYFFTLFCGTIYIYVSTRAKFNDYYLQQRQLH